MIEAQKVKEERYLESKRDVSRTQIVIEVLESMIRDLACALLAELRRENASAGLPAGHCSVTDWLGKSREASEEDIAQQIVA